MYRFAAIGLFAVWFAIMSTVPAVAGDRQSPLYPVTAVVYDTRADEVYPSVAGHFLVYSVRKKGVYGVVQTSIDDIGGEGRMPAHVLAREAIRFGVAVRDGGIGYVSNRMGPVSAWKQQSQGEGQMSVTGLAVFSGALVPMNLNASPDGRVWCFDTPLDKVLQSRAITQFGDISKHMELLGQTWRFYSSDAFQHKLAYRATRTGNPSRFQPPVLFVIRGGKKLIMIANAFDGAISPDGKRVVFVRENNGNYDLWLEDLDGGGLTQLTSSPYADLEPAWSPDGHNIAFVSNRDSRGDVRVTSIYVLNLDSGKTVRLTNARTATDAGPTWLSTHAILFHSNRSAAKPQARTVSNWNIWRVDFDMQEVFR